jgi:hypothetical protein
MANLFKVMKSGSLQLQADLSLAGHPNKSPSIPTATKFDWDLLQDMDYCTLLCTHCHTGNPHAWQRGIAVIYAADVHDTRSLLLSLAQTRRTISHHRCQGAAHADAEIDDTGVGRGPRNR